MKKPSTSAFFPLYRHMIISKISAKEKCNDWLRGQQKVWISFTTRKRKVKHGCSWSCFSHFTVWPICLMVIFSIWQPEKDTACFCEKLNRSFTLELFQKLFSWRGCKILVIRLVLFSNQGRLLPSSIHVSHHRRIVRCGRWLRKEVLGLRSVPFLTFSVSYPPQKLALGQFPPFVVENLRKVGWRHTTSLLYTKKKPQKPQLLQPINQRSHVSLA